MHKPDDEEEDADEDDDADDGDDDEGDDGEDEDEDDDDDDDDVQDEMAHLVGAHSLRTQNEAYKRASYCVQEGERVAFVAAVALGLAPGQDIVGRVWPEFNDARDAFFENGGDILVLSRHLHGHVGALCDERRPREEKFRVLVAVVLLST